MQDGFEVDLREFFRLLVKRFWAIILCAVIAGTSVLVYTVNFVTPVYEASVAIYVNNNSRKDSATISSSDLAVALRLVATYVNIIRSDRVLDKVVAESGLSIPPQQLRSMISADAIGETEMFRVSVISPNPELSAQLANAIAKVAPAEISEIIEGSSAKIIDYAKAPQQPSAPNYLKYTFFGAAAGAVLAILALFLQVIMDTRIKTEEDLLRICTIPVLGAIPDLSADVQKKSGKNVRR